jgi:SAM-dependent methyltransferase
MPDPVPPRPSLGKPAEAGQFILARRHRLISQHVPLGPDQVLLDFGCGSGAQALLFAHQVGRVVGVDVVPGHVRALQAAARAQGVAGRTAAVLYDGDRLPLADASVDVVISCEVLEHVADEATALREIRRVLRPGGHLALTVPNKWWVFETHGARLPLLPWNRVPLFSWLPGPLHRRWAQARIYRRGPLVRLLARHGLTVEHTAHVTAPLDMLPAGGLRDRLRRTVFRADTTVIPMLATAILAVARR